MTPKPTGRLRGDDLVLTRTFRAPIDDVWTSVTRSESTARWFGPWERVDGTIERCEPPHALSVRTKSDYGEKVLTLTLVEAAGVTTLEFVHHRVNRKAIGELGPGWEYYLDMLVASRDGAPLPAFEAYYPSQKEHFAALA